MANATWWKAEYDEPDGKCLVSKPDPKNKDGKPIMVWVDCDWRGGHLVTASQLFGSQFFLINQLFQGYKSHNDNCETVYYNQAHGNKATW